LGAIGGLAQEGLLVRRRGSGNCVGSRIQKNLARPTSLSEDMRARGRAPSSQWLKRSEGLLTPEEAMRLAFSPGARVCRFDRLRLADDQPMALEFCTVAACALPSQGSVKPSLYDALERAGNRPVRALQRLRAQRLSADEARLLQAMPGDSSLVVERVGYLREGRAIALSRSVYQGATPTTSWLD
jgi:GntR family transcriptional regulator